MSTTAKQLPVRAPWPIVLDTQVLYDDIVYRLRHEDRPGFLLTASATGAARLFAARHVYAELYDLPEDQHQRREVARDEFVNCLETHYLRHLSFVEIPEEQVDPRSLPVADRDEDDRPTAELALMLAPALVLTHDKDLIDSGFGAPDDWLPLVRAAVEASELDAFMLVGLGVLRSTGRRAVSVGRWLAADLRLPQIATAVALALLVLRIMPHGVGRALEAVLEGGARTLRNAGLVMGQIAFATASERGQRGARLSSAAIDPGGEPSVLARVARHLAVQGPTGPEALARVLAIRVEVVASLLSRHPGFVRVSDEWQLGRRLPGRTSGLEPSSGS